MRDIWNLLRTKQVKFERLLLLPFETLIACIAIISSARFFFHPDNPVSVIQPVSHPWDYIWAAIYMISGFSVILGLIVVDEEEELGHRNLEAAGLVLMMSGVAIQSLVGFLTGTYDFWLHLTFALGIYFSSVRLKQIIDGVWVKKYNHRNETVVPL